MVGPSPLSEIMVNAPIALKLAFGFNMGLILEFTVGFPIKFIDIAQILAFPVEFLFTVSKPTFPTVICSAFGF